MILQIGATAPVSRWGSVTLWNVSSSASPGKLLSHGSQVTKAVEKMLRAAAILEAEKESFARVMTIEMGKTYTSALAEVASAHIIYSTPRPAR